MTEPGPQTSTDGDRKKFMLKRALGANTVANYLLPFLAVVYTLYFARTLIIPVVLALLFSLLLTPLVNFLERFYVPRTLSAIVLLALIGVPFVLVGNEVTKAAQEWASRLPSLAEELQKEMGSVGESVEPADETEEGAAGQAAHATMGSFSHSSGDVDVPASGPNGEEKKGSPITERVEQGGIDLLVYLMSATPAIIVQLLTFVVLVLFLLVFGRQVYATAIGNLPSITDKKHALKLVGDVQSELSRYILAISVINFFLGAITGTVLWYLTVEDAFLWGALVGLLNYAPYVGPMISLVMLTLAGIVQFGLELSSCIPALVYFVLNLIEAQFVTPLILGRHMRLNPLVLIVWIVIWGWLWGFAGVLLAVPMLVCLKLSAEHFQVLSGWVSLIESES